MNIRRLALCMILICMSVGVASIRAQETVKESSTGKAFPMEVKFSAGGQEFTVKLTGLTVRKKVVFKVYGMAHYMEDAVKAGSKDEAFKAVLADGKAKQITMDFARDVTPDKIADAYRDGFKENGTTEELKSIGPLIEKFVGYFGKEVKENEKLILRWLPGGTIIANIQGEEKPPITNGTFARVLWTIWFGKDSIVDRDDLVERISP